MRRLLVPAAVVLLALPAAAAAGGGKLAMTAFPQAGKLPLKVTFTLAAPRATSWRLDFGDGRSAAAKGRPPARITHVYRGKGSFTARLHTTYASVTTVTKLPPVTLPAPRPAAGAASPKSLPLVIVGMAPPAKSRPRTVEFSLATIAPARISSWELVFGDGKRASGTGSPPASVSHTYARGGTYRAYAVLTEASADRFSRYTVPASGVPVSIR